MMDILIVDQCSGSKDFPGASPVLDIDEVDTSSRETVIEKDGIAAKKAKNLYSGRQQALIDEATNLLRQSGATVDRFFISAGFGVVDESTLLPPYEATFASMSKEQIRGRSERLGIQDDLLEQLAGKAYDLVFFALGKDYVTAIDVEELVRHAAPETMFVLFNHDERGYENALELDARTDQAREFGVIVVELKGKLIKNFAERIADGKTVDSLEDVQEYCTYNPQGSLDSF